jgi:transposase
LGRVDISLLSPVWHRSAEAQADLAVIRSRDAPVAARTQLINAVRGMVKSTGGRLPTSTTAAFAGNIAALVPTQLKLAMAPLLKSIYALSQQIRCYDAQIERLAEKKYPQTGV